MFLFLSIFVFPVRPKEDETIIKYKHKTDQFLLTITILSVLFYQFIKLFFLFLGGRISIYFCKHFFKHNRFDLILYQIFSAESIVLWFFIIFLLDFDSDQILVFNNSTLNVRIGRNIVIQQNKKEEEPNTLVSLVTWYFLELLSLLIGNLIH